METFWQDLRYSLRTLFKKPGFAFVVVFTLALGIGANATIFTWIKAVLLASLPGIEQQEKLVEIDLAGDCPRSHVGSECARLQTARTFWQNSWHSFSRA